MKLFAALGLALLVSPLAACAEGARRAPDAGAAAPTLDPPASPHEEASEAPSPITILPLEAGQETLVPAGIVLAGSRPGNPDRDPRREADLIAIRLPAFRIDRLPYPNDPAVMPRMGISRSEAGTLCAADGKRLCTELEWERACKGDTDRDYPGAPLTDMEICHLEPLRCASPFGAVSLGVEGFEWTSSDVTRGLGSPRYSAVVRGGRPDDAIAEHRCGARHALDPVEADADVGFRCCGSETDESPPLYPSEGSRRAFRNRAVPEDELRAILGTMPELARFAPRFRLFDAEEIDRALSRGDAARDTIPWTLSEGVLVWSPEHGETAWVFAGSNGESTLLAVIHPMPDGTFVHGSSFVIAGESAPPVALAWDYGLRRQVLWSAAWGVTGEGGVVEHRDNHRIVILSR